MTDFAHVLEASLEASKKDIRAAVGNIIFNDKEYLALGDRLNFIHLYNYDKETNIFKLENSFQAHDGWVGFLTYIKPCSRYPKGALVSGSHDKSVKVWNIDSILSNDPKTTPPTPIDTYYHDAQVCYLFSFNDGTGRIISTSWDSTCRIFDPNQEEKVPIILKHENLAIWSVSPIPGGYVTCGADKTLRIWTEKGDHVSTIQEAHSLSVRSCHYIDSKKTLVTISNDGYIKEWKVNGLSLENISSIRCTNDEYLYSLLVLNGDDDDTYVVTSEDRCVYFVSSKMKKIVDVVFNYDTVWCVSKLNNNDIVCGSADGFALVFTNDKSRSCDKETLEKYFDKLKSLQNPELEQTNPFGLTDIKNLSSSNHQVGTSSIVRNNKRLSLFSWSKGYNKWIEIGGFGINSKYLKMMNVKDETGKVWDRCITINIDDDKSYPLYMNFDSDEKKLADDFMKKNNLDPSLYTQKTIEEIHQKSREDVGELSTFPMKKLSYYTENISDKTFDELNLINKQNLNGFVLSEEQIETLKKPISNEFFEVLQKAVSNWDVDHISPLLDILRCRILDKQARDFIKNQELSEFVHRLIHVDAEDDKISEEFIVLLIKIVINMFINFTSLVLEDDELVIELLSRFSDRFDDFKPKTHSCFAALVSNYSTLMCFKPEMCVQLMEVIIDVTKPEINNVALFRLLSACGNLTFYSEQAKMKLQLHPEVILDFASSQVTNECKYVMDIISVLMKS